MKIRLGFVSNSSSSAFLIAYDTASALYGLKGDDGYSTLRTDLQTRCSDAELRDFFWEKLHAAAWRVASSSWLILIRGETDDSWFDALLREDTEDKRKARKIMRTAMRRAKEADWAKRNGDNKRESELMVKIAALCADFADIMMEAVKHSGWKNVNVVSYSDECDSGYMEHVFMSHAEALSNGRTLLVSRVSNH